MSTTHISHSGHEHKEWLSSLDYYRQELEQMKKRLTDLAPGTSDASSAAEIEHYENQFTIQKSNIERLRHDIKHNQAALHEGVQGLGNVEDTLLDQYNRLRDSLEIEEKTLKTLQQEFEIFSSSRVANLAN